MLWWIRLVAGPVFAGIVYAALWHYGLPHGACLMACLLIWMGWWWMSEPVHLAVTSLLPFVVIPFTGAMKTEEVAMQYMDPIIFLFMGGFFIAYALEKWGLHQRMAHFLIRKAGNRPSRVLLGVMLSAYVLSMWVSNTATVMMLLAAVLAVVKQEALYEARSHRQIASAMLIGLSFSATIGGMATPVGTPPNMIFAGFYARQFPDARPVDFLQWMKLGVPFSLAMLVLCYGILRGMFIPQRVDKPFDLRMLDEQLSVRSPMRYEEKAVAIIFLMTAALWVFRDTFQIGKLSIPGWTSLFGHYGAQIKDSTVAIGSALLLFMLPAKNRPGRLLEWSDTKELPLGIILLFGAGFALAAGMERTGVSALLAQKLTALKGADTFFILLGIAATVTLMSEFASNTATVQLVLPVIIPLSASLGITPLPLMLTATFAASLGYMLPVATAANTIVYGSGYIKVSAMMRAGALLDVLGILLLTFAMHTLGKYIYYF
ncbi:MAG: DASS family sodium-coupled anion symporter [Chitinophagales bacterium]|nr:DASS family sodium-coupled anion symporter [Chitinophagales bacterium]MDW8419967.1 DASS family sodium-coupled anion symporter [Chitinophagales bacterium]